MLVLKHNNGQRRAGELTPPLKGRGGRHGAETIHPTVTPAATSGGQGGTHPRGVIPGDLHSLEIWHRLVGRRGRDVFINVGHFGGRCLAFWNGQINSLPSEETLFSRFEIKINN